MNKIVSVCMASYNGEKYIYEQIKSILDQLPTDGELIVSDDGSTDNTLNIINSFNDDRIKIYYNHNKKGPIGNFQNSLNNANGDYIFLSDQDDIWFDQKIKVMSNHLEKYDIVNCNCKIINNNLEIIADSYFQYINSGPGFFKNLRRNTYMGNCMAFKKKILKLALPFPSSIPNHDLWIGFVGDLFYKTYFLTDILGLHRRHDNNASNTFDIKIRTSKFQKINKRIILFYHLPRLFFRALLYGK